MSLLDDFVREYQEYHALSPGRRTDQLRALRRLSERTGKDVTDHTASDIRQHLATMRDEGMHVNTIAKELNLLRPFFRWAYEAGHVNAELALSIQGIEAPRGNGNGLPRPYSRKELDRFRAQLAKRWPEVEDKWWQRWRRGTSRFKRVQTHVMRIQIEAIVALALNCGLRRREIFDLELDDFHYDNAYVVVQHGKGDKAREVPHTASSREAVRRWLELRSELNPDHDKPWLCLAWEDIALKPMRWERFQGIIATVGDWQLHRFRHTAGTEWLRATKRIEIVSRLLGHANIQQTLGYAEIVRDDLHDAIAKAERQFEDRVAA